MMDWSAHFLCFLAGAMFMLLAQIFGKTIWNVLLLCVRAIHKESIPNRLPKADGHRLSPINRKTARATPLSNNASRYFDDVVQLRQGSVSIEKQQNNDVSLTIVRDRNGDICGEEHLVCNIPHRNDGPARWIKDGLGLTQEYWVDGKKHRQDDPAVIIKMVDGSERLEY